jgi:hypothetical protein
VLIKKEKRNSKKKKENPLNKKMNHFEMGIIESRHRVLDIDTFSCAA